MKEFQVPIHPITVDVFTTEHALLQGSLFVGDSPYRTGSPEELVELLNDDRSFLPFASPDPDTGKPLLNKTHILHVRLDRNTDTYEHEHLHDGSTDVTLCTLVLDDGSCLTGRFILPTPMEASRAVDKLNQASRFIPFVSNDGIHFVQCSHIVRVY